MDNQNRSARACAKLNLFLEVAGKREDGYHDIDSVFAEIDFADTIWARSAPEGVTLDCDDPALPAGEENIAVRAALALREFQRARARPPANAPAQGLELRLHKRIPSGGGLGGGSSDAAAALLLANAIWDCGLSVEDLLPLAAGLGADVPFFLRGGVCRCRGKGDRIDALPAFPDRLELGLAIPPFPSSTVNAYKTLRLPTADRLRSAEPFIEAMARGRVGELRELAFNRFEENVFRDIPQLGVLHAELEGLLGHSARMSGSGSVLWFFAEKGWRGNERLAAWAEERGVGLISTRAARRSLPC